MLCLVYIVYANTPMHGLKISECPIEFCHYNVCCGIFLSSNETVLMNTRKSHCVFKQKTTKQKVFFSLE